MDTPQIIQDAAPSGGGSGWVELDYSTGTVANSSADVVFSALSEGARITYDEPSNFLNLRSTNLTVIQYDLAALFGAWVEDADGIGIIIEHLAHGGDTLGSAQSPCLGVGFSNANAYATREAWAVGLGAASFTDWGGLAWVATADNRQHDTGGLGTWGAGDVLNGHIIPTAVSAGLAFMTAVTAVGENRKSAERDATAGTFSVSKLELVAGSIGDMTGKVSTLDFRAWARRIPAGRPT